MEAVYELLARNPSDDRTQLAALVVAERTNTWAYFLEVLAAESPRSNIQSKVYLDCLTSCLRNVHVQSWPLKRIEEVLTSCLPRWGSMIAAESLGSLFGLLHVIVSHGIGVIKDSSTVPRQMSESVQRAREGLLRIIWYSSALTTMLTVLKCTVGDTDDAVVNVLLQHHSGSEKLKQSVVEAQENALECLAAMFACALIDDASLAQLAGVLKQAGSDVSDSASLPLVVSVASFLVGEMKVKVRPETVDAAAACLSGIIDLCDLSPSLFEMNSRIRGFGDKILIAALTSVKDRNSGPCMRLICSFVSKLPSVCISSKALLEGVQTQQALFPTAAALLTESAVPLAETEAITSGRAIALSRANDVSKSTAFIEKSFASDDWLASEIVPSSEDVKTLSNYYSFLQSVRVRPEWVTDNHGSVSAVALTHAVRSVTNQRTFALESAEINVSIVNDVLAKTESSLDLVRSSRTLLTSYLEGTADSNLIERCKVALLSALAESDLETVRECPALIEALVVVLEQVLQHDVSRTGGILLTQKHSEESQQQRARALEITVKTLVDALSFARSKVHIPLVDACCRAVPLLVAVGEDVETLQRLTEIVIANLPAETALTAAPSALSCFESLVQANGHDMHSRTQIATFLESLIAEFSQSPTTTPAVVVKLLSVIASTVLAIQCPVSPAVVWRVLACHPAIQTAAAAPSWNGAKRKYSTQHLVWVHALHVAEVLLSLGLKTGSEKFFSVYSDLFIERFATAHTSDLATLEEACLISRLFELSGISTKTAVPFQFTSLVTPKPPAVYPKSRAEKLAGGAASLDDDVQSPCAVPCVFAQRVVWIAADILGSSMRRIIRQADTGSDPTLFHALLDCSHFVLQYLSEVGAHRSRLLKLTSLGSDVQYVPLSVQLAVDGTEALTKAPAKKSTGGSLLSSMASPPMTAKKAPTASLMDSLSPRNSPKSKDTVPAVAAEVKFLPPLAGDCPLRTGLSFVAPSLVTEDDFLSKLVDVLSLCLIHATRLAATEALIRPLLDLLLTTRSTGAKLPHDALDIINQVIELITPRYNELATATQNKRRDQVSLQQSPKLRPAVPAIGGNPLGYAAISNIR